MNVMSTGSCTRLAAAIVAACLSPGPSNVTRADPDAARRATQQVEALVAKHDFDAAAATLSEVDCAGEAKCQTLVDFSYGWLFESWPAREPEQAREYLLRAQRYYARAHELNPGSTQVLTNLALVSQRIGDLSTAADAIEKVIALAPEQALQQYIFLGDMFMSANNTGAAVEAYHSAVKLNVASRPAQQRLQDAYRRSGAYQALYDQGVAILDDLPELAASGFAYALEDADARDSGLADRALVRWTAVRSDLGTLNRDSLGPLPGHAEWASAGLDELRHVVETERVPDSSTIGWWLKAPERQDAIARALRQKATSLRAAAEFANIEPPQRVAQMQLAIDFLKAAVEFAPPFDAYLGTELSKSSNARLDAAADLVALHYSIKAGSGLETLKGTSADELQLMTEILFSGKAGAYAAGQLNAIQRYHTVLGMIYYTTGRLTSDWADNATFQLEHALSVAAKIARQDETQYRPLPELQNLLADVYRREGRSEDSARLSLDAAMGYLETDNLREAAAALDQATTLHADPGRAQALLKVLEGRRVIETMGIAAVEASPGSPVVVLRPELAWIDNSETLALPRRFVDGQRFKVLAELAAVLDESGNAEAAQYASAKALDAYATQPTLLSPADLRRLQRIETRISGNTEAASADDRGRWNEAQSGRAQEWSVTSGTSRAVVKMAPAVLEEGQEILHSRADQALIQYRQEQQ